MAKLEAVCFVMLPLDADVVESLEILYLRNQNNCWTRHQRFVEECMMKIHIFFEAKRFDCFVL
jgi:hypothetical protein